MISLLQRVTAASVVVGGSVIAEIDQGLLVLVGVEKDDTEQKSQRLAERLITYRVFSDHDEKMNLSVTDVQGGLLLVPQFTLAADTRKGARPSFSRAATPAQGLALFQHFVAAVRQLTAKVEVGQFGADMKVNLVNDGPVTFWLQIP